jgi:hypothetical protein
MFGCMTTECVSTDGLPVGDKLQKLHDLAQHGHHLLDVDHRFFAKGFGIFRAAA